MSKKIIIIGPAAAGKDHLKKRLGNKGYKLDVSYTSRDPRKGEVDGKDYNFISKDEFTLRISQGDFYEHAEHGGHYYGTGKYEWENYDVFIMETEGVSKISANDRKNCLTIYLNPEWATRQTRLMVERGWTQEVIHNRLVTDTLKFENFTDYDVMITNSDF